MAIQHFLISHHEVVISKIKHISAVMISSQMLDSMMPILGSLLANRCLAMGQDKAMMTAIAISLRPSEPSGRYNFKVFIIFGVKI